MGAAAYLAGGLLRPIRSPPACDRWFVDEAYVKVNRVWRYVYRVINQYGQVIAALISARRAAAAARQLKRRLRPMQGLQSDRIAQVVIAGHALVQNLRRGHYDIALNTLPATRLAAAFGELARGSEQLRTRVRHVRR